MENGSNNVDSKNNNNSMSGSKIAEKDGNRSHHSASLSHSLDLIDNDDNDDIDYFDDSISEVLPVVAKSKSLDMDSAKRSAGSSPTSLPGAIEDLDDEPATLNSGDLLKTDSKSTGTNGTVDDNSSAHHNDLNDAKVDETVLSRNGSLQEPPSQNNPQNNNRDVEIYENSNRRVSGGSNRQQQIVFDRPSESNLNSGVENLHNLPNVSNTSNDYPEGHLLKSNEANYNAELQEAIINQINKGEGEPDLDYNDPIVKTILGTTANTKSDTRSRDFLETDSNDVAELLVEKDRELKPMDRIRFPPHQNKTSRLRQKIGQMIHKRIVEEDKFMNIFYRKRSAVGRNGQMSRSHSIPGSAHHHFHEEEERFPLHHVASDSRLHMGTFSATDYMQNTPAAMINGFSHQPAVNSIGASKQGKSYKPVGPRADSSAAQSNAFESTVNNRSPAKRKPAVPAKPDYILAAAQNSESSPEKRRSQTNKADNALQVAVAKHKERVNTKARTLQDTNKTKHTEAILNGVKQKLEAGNHAKPGVHKSRSTSNVASEVNGTKSPRKNLSNNASQERQKKPLNNLNGEPANREVMHKPRSISVRKKPDKVTISRTKSDEFAKQRNVWDIEDIVKSGLTTRNNIKNEDNAVQNARALNKRNPSKSPEKTSNSNGAKTNRNLSPGKDSPLKQSSPKLGQKSENKSKFSPNLSRKNEPNNSTKTKLTRQKAHKSPDGATSSPEKTPKPSPSVKRKSNAANNRPPPTNPSLAKFNAKHRKMSKEDKQRSLDIGNTQENVAAKMKHSLSTSKSKSDEDIAKTVAEIENETKELNPSPTGFFSSSRKFLSSVLQRNKSADSNRDPNDILEKLDENNEKKPKTKNHDSGVATEESGTPASSAGSASKQGTKNRFLPKSNSNTSDSSDKQKKKQHSTDMSKQDSTDKKSGKLQKNTDENEINTADSNEHEDKKEENEGGDDDDDEEEDDGAEEAETIGPDGTKQPGRVKEDVSTRLLRLCKKGEWTLVESLLRTTKKKRLNLSMADENGLTPLMFAVKDNKIPVVERLIELGADLEETTRDGRNVAHIAALYSKEDTMRYLIGKKVRLAVAAGPKEQIPLHLVCSRPSNVALPIVNILLKAAAAANDPEPRLVEDKNGCIPLMIACEAGNLPVCKELLNHLGHQQTKVRRRDTGDGLLHVAVHSKNPDLIKLLGEHGAAANIQNDAGQTPLHILAAEGQESMLRLFYNLKADANIADKDEKTPLHIAAEKGYTNIVEILADKFKASVLARTKDGSTLMHIASKFGHSDTALAFLKRGVPLHMPNKSGALGLHLAAALGHVGVVKALLAKGTPVDSRTKDNYTPLHVAVQAEKPEVVETLLGHGADVSVMGGKLGETALHVAAGLKSPGGRYCADMLLKSGADVNLKLENGETALHVASKNGNVPMVKLLLAEGADPMATSKIGDSALHIAARNCHHETAKILLDHIERNKRREDCTALVNSQTVEGETPMHLVAENTKDECHYENEDVDLVHLLVEYGGEVNITTISNGETVLHYAARSGNEDVMAAIAKKIGPGAVQIALNRQDKSGWSPLMEACEKGHIPAVKILLQHHARVDVFDEFGKTALHLSAENGHTEICDLLLKHKAFINSKTKTGVTPLHLAAQNGYNKVVTLLVQAHKAIPDATTLDNRTPLHLAAQAGQLNVCNTLLSMGANATAHDIHGQTPLHLAAESDHPDVVKLFLKLKPDLTTLMATDENGLTCAHIAAMKGSVAVVKELMMMDKNMVTEVKTKNNEQTSLHFAAAGGHKNVVRILLSAGANPLDENTAGMTPIQLAARFGHTQVLDVFDTELWSRCSKKTGLSAIQVAAYYGQMEFVRNILAQVSATARSEPPTSFNPLIIKELATEYGLTPLHMAALSGHEGLVRLLLNFAGVQVDAASVLMSVIPLHLAAQSGHIAVVGMLLSRSTQQLHIKDSKGRTALHLAASQGHYEMVSLLIAQGSNINVLDQQGWTSLHYATKAGHTQVVKLLVESGADPLAETREGKVSLCFAAANNHMGVLIYLMHQAHDTHGLMDDRKFIFDLMVCGKNQNNKAVEEFILVSPAPIDTAVKLSSIYKVMAGKEKERAKDLFNIAEFCEGLAVELLAVAAQSHNPAIILKAQDSRGRPFIDVLIENEQKAVVSHASVQGYLTEVWSGGIHWGLGKFALFFVMVFFCPPAWIFFSLPFSFRVSEAPIIKFVCHLVSHIYFTILLVMETLCLVNKIHEIHSPWPSLSEWVLLLWLSGILVSELSSVGGRSGLAFVRLVEIFLAANGVLLHMAAFIYPYYLATDLKTPTDKLKSQQGLLYLRNQMFSFTLLFGFVQYLEFLTVHHLFGPWAVIIRDLMYDLARFLVILFLFMSGFTLHIASIFQPAYAPIPDDNDHDKDLMKLINSATTLQMLYFALFGLVDPTNMPPQHLVPESGQTLLKLVFGIYLMVINIVLINLLIAMMSDTYQRIQAQSDIEWKFGRAKLIRQMNKKSATPPPINMFTKFFMLVRVAYKNRCNMCTSKAQEDLRYIENIDAYSMSEQAGRISPSAKMMNSQTNEENAFGGAELGASSEWKIENVINWKHVVEQFYISQGSILENETTPASGKGPTEIVKDETGKTETH